MKARLLGSLLAGVVVAAALVVFEDKYRHAALVASAARSGSHQTVTSILAAGFAGITLIVALVVFVLVTVWGRAAALGALRRSGVRSISAAARGRGTVTGHGYRYAVQDARQRRRTGGRGPRGPRRSAGPWSGPASRPAPPITVLAVMNGIRIPGLQVVLSVLATWVLLMVLAVTVAELLRRHHRALGPVPGGAASGPPCSPAATAARVPAPPGAGWPARPPPGGRTASTGRSCSPAGPPRSSRRRRVHPCPADGPQHKRPCPRPGHG